VFDRCFNGSVCKVILQKNLSLGCPSIPIVAKFSESPGMQNISANIETSVSLKCPSKTIRLKFWNPAVTVGIRLELTQLDSIQIENVSNLYLMRCGKMGKIDEMGIRKNRRNEHSLKL